jgi:hypothetical protein
MRTQAEILKERARQKRLASTSTRNDIPQRQRPKKPEFKNENEEMQWIQNEDNKDTLHAVKEYSKLLKQHGIKTKKEKKPMTKTELIKSIPHDTYNEKHVHKIVELIRDGTITDIEQFPTPSKTGKKVSLEFIKKKQPEPESESDESESDVEEPPVPPVKKGFEGTFTKFGNLDSFSKDMLVKVLERRTKIDPKVRASIRNAIKNNKCQSPEQFDNYKLKEKKAPPPKAPKKEKPTEPYYGLPPVPPKKHQASMLESAKAKKINYWGLKQADPKVIESVNEKPKEKKGEVMVKMAGLKGQLTRLKKEYEQAKTTDEKQAKMAEHDSKRQELLILNEKYQKMT